MEEEKGTQIAELRGQGVMQEIRAWSWAHVLDFSTDIDTFRAAGGQVVHMGSSYLAWHVLTSS
jgi:hypothetical protein